MKKAPLLMLLYYQRFGVVVAIEDTYRIRGEQERGVSNDKLEVRVGRLLTRPERGGRPSHCVHVMVRQTGPGPAFRHPHMRGGSRHTRRHASKHNVRYASVYAWRHPLAHGVRCLQALS